MRKIKLWYIVLGAFILVCLWAGTGIWDIYQLECEKYNAKSYDVPVGEPMKLNALATGDHKLRQMEYEASEFQRLGDGHYFIAFDKTFFGTVMVHLPNPAEKDMSFTVILGEKRQGDRVWNKADGGINCGDEIVSYKQTVDVAAGQQDVIVQLPNRKLPLAEEMPAGMSGVLPFKYVEIVDGPELTQENIKMLAVTYPMDRSQAGFVSNNKVLNDVWELSRHALEATSFAGVYVDGERERLPYEADAYISQLGDYNISSDYTLARRTLLYLLEHPTWPVEWNFHAISMAYTDYMYSGDKEFLAKMYDSLKTRSLSEYAREDGLLDTRDIHLGDLKMQPIVDWPENERDGYATIPVREKYWKNTLRGWQASFKSKVARFVGWNYAADKLAEESKNAFCAREQLIPINTVVNACYYRSLDRLAFMAGELGRVDEQQMWLVKRDQVKTAMQAKLFDNETGLFVDGEGTDHISLHANMYALAFGLVPEGHVPDVNRFLEERGMRCSVFGAQFLLEAFGEANNGAAIVNLLTSQDDRSWAHMIYDVQSGMTTEAWDNAIKPNQDWNHAWATAPANIIPRYLFGIRPLEPGFKKILIKPLLMGCLEDASIAVPTQHGVIKVGYTAEAGKHRFKITVPDGCTAEFVNPLTGEAKTLGSGENVVEVDR